MVLRERASAAGTVRGLQGVHQGELRGSGSFTSTPLQFLLGSGSDGRVEASPLTPLES